MAVEYHHSGIIEKKKTQDVLEKTKRLDVKTVVSTLFWPKPCFFQT